MLALLETKTFLNKVKGKKFEFPVYYDVEESYVLKLLLNNICYLYVNLFI